MLLWFESVINISPSEKGHTLLIFKAFLYIFSHFLSPIYVNEIFIIYKILIKIPDIVKTHAVVCMGAGGMGAGRGSMGGGAGEQCLHVMELLLSLSFTVKCL